MSGVYSVNTTVNKKKTCLSRWDRVNPFKANGISHYYQLGQSISDLRVVGGVFHFYRTFCKRTMENLIRHRVLRRPIWFVIVCGMSHKKDVRLIRVK